jgi:hypothetical protein
MQTTSLSAYCKGHKLPKASVYKFLKAEGYDTANGMTPAAIAAANAYFLDQPQQVATETTISGGLSVVVGNHCTTIDTPSYQGLTVDLAQFRDSEALVIDDPLDVAIKFLQTADQIQAALQNDLSAREQRLAQTQQAKEAIAAKAQALQLSQGRYRLQTAQLDQAQSAETKALAANLEALQALGKHQPAESPQQ